MLRKSALFLALVMVLTSTGVTLGNEPASVEDVSIKEFNYRIRKNEAFLEAARKIVRESDKKEAVPFLEMAEALSREAYTHYDAGEKVLAVEDIHDSARLAILAITLSKLDDESIRDIVIEEELVMKELRDRAKKEAAIGRRITEVETFIETAERLIYADPEKENPRAVSRLDAAKAAFESAKKELRRGDPDSAYEDINRAYTFATQSVKEIKRSKDEVITFPPPPSEDAGSVYTHELKKNDTYIFFASQVEGSGSEEAERLFKEGSSLRDLALKLKESGKVEEATNKLKESTRLFIKMIKTSVRQEK